MALTREQLLEQARHLLSLEKEALQHALENEEVEAKIQEAYQQKEEKLEHAKLNPAQLEEDLSELQRARDLLLLDQRQTRMALNRQTMQEELETNSQMTVQDDLGREVTVTMPVTQDVNQMLPPNGLFLLPKFQVGAGSGNGRETNLDNSRFIQISEQAAHKIADERGLQPIRPNVNSAGQLQSFTTNQALDPQKQQMFQKQFNTELATHLKAFQTQQGLNQKANMQQKAGEQKLNERGASSIRSPFATKPIPPGGVK